MRGPRGLSLGSYESVPPYWRSLTNLNHSDTQVDQVVDSILFRYRESSMLIQSPSVFIRHTLSEQDVQRDDSDFVEGARR